MFITGTATSTDPQPLAPMAAELAYFSVHNWAFESKTCLLYLYSRLCPSKKKKETWLDDEVKVHYVSLYNQSACYFNWSVLTISAISPSSGFGSLSSNPILVKTVAMFNDGCQAPCQWYVLTIWQKLLSFENMNFLSPHVPYKRKFLQCTFGGKFRISRQIRPPLSILGW